MEEEKDRIAYTFWDVGKAYEAKEAEMQGFCEEEMGLTRIEDRSAEGEGQKGVRIPKWEQVASDLQAVHISDGRFAHHGTVIQEDDTDLVGPLWTRSSGLFILETGRKVGLSGRRKNVA